MQVETLMAQAEKVDKRIRMRTVNLPKITYEPGAIRIGKTRATLDDNGMRELLQELQIPAPYWRRIDDDLRTYTVNHLLQQREGTEKQLYILDGKKLVGFQNPGRPRIKVVDFYKEVMDSIPDDKWEISEKDTTLTPFECRVSILAPREHQIKKGDLVKVGGTVTFSPFGGIVPRVQAYAYRLACTNGMIAPALQHTMTCYGKDKDSMFEKVRTVVRTTWLKLEDIIQGFKDLTKTKVENPQEYMEHLFQVHHLPPGMRDYVRDAFEEEPGDSLWEITNAFTRAANSEDLKEDYKSRTVLQSMGGEVALGDHRCKICGHSLN